MRRNVVKNRKLNRLTDFNYSKSGYYFVTICTKNKINYFGKIENDKIILSNIGKTTDCFWQKIPEHFPNVKLDKYVVMPNHVHGIIIIESNSVGTEHCSVPTRYGLVSKVVKSFKEIVTKTTRRKFNNYNFKWQQSFYDHIIRNEESLNKIKEYIIYNPTKWAEDKNNIENYIKK